MLPLASGRFVITKSMAFGRVRAIAVATPTVVAAPARGRISQRTAMGLGAGIYALLELQNSGVRCAEGDEVVVVPPAPAASEVPVPPKGSADAPATAEGDSGAPATGSFPLPPFLTDSLVQQIGVGSIAGLCSGMATRKLGRVVAIGLGFTFVALQGLQYFGIIENVRWDKVNSAVIAHLDDDKDGKVTTTDIKRKWDRMLQFLGYGMPSGAAFATAFVIGLTL